MKALQKLVIKSLFSKKSIITFIIALVVYLGDKYLLDSELIRMIVELLQSI